MFEGVDVDFEVLVDGDLDVEVEAGLDSGAEEGVLCTRFSGWKGGQRQAMGFLSSLPSWCDRGVCL